MIFMLYLIFIKNNKSSHTLFVCVCYVFQVLRCVDKQGILSWPSPNPEKILILSKSTSSQATEAKEAKKLKRVGLKDAIQVNRCIFGLKWVCFMSRNISKDLIWCLYSQDPLTVQSADVKFVGGSGSVQFDDTCWERHAPYLRPLGLAVQLVLCDPGVTTRILRPSDHLTHAALACTRPPCQPVRPPWGLCQGFR